MTPDEFRKSIVPKMATMWVDQCFCASPQYRKIVGFNFNDFGLGPVGLADSEILIQEFVRNRCVKLSEPDKSSFEIIQAYKCPQCHRHLTEHYDEYSINMNRSHIVFQDQGKMSQSCLFMVGWYGFDNKDFSKIEGYGKTDSIEKFLNQMKVIE